MHFITKTTLSLQIPGSPAEALDLQQQAQRVWEQEVLPALDAAFDRMAGESELIQIDRIEVDVKGLDASNWRQELARRITQAVVETIEKQLSGTVPDAVAKRIPMSLGQFESWCFFLEHGYLPLTGKQVDEAALRQSALETIAAQSVAQQSLIQLLRRSDTALQRLIWQHPHTFLRSLAEAITGRSQQNALVFNQEMETLMARTLVTTTSKKANPIVGKGPITVPIIISQSLKTTWATFQEKWPEIFQTNLWREYVLSDRSFETAPFLMGILVKKFSSHEIASLLLWLKQTVEAEPQKFPLVLPAVIYLLERHPGSPAVMPQQQTEPLQDVSPPPSTESKQPTDSDNLTSAKGEDRNIAQPSMNGDTEPDKANVNPGDLKEEQAQKMETNVKAANPVEKQIQSKSEAIEIKNGTESPNPETTKSPDKKTDTPAEPTKRSENAHWYVSNAGIVLLHPFLPTFFQNLGLTVDREFKNEAARHKAVYLIHYLATGEFDVPEYDLVFPKHLCGLPPETPLQKAANVKKSQQKKVKTEADELLKTVIKYWKRLGSTSPDGLRNGFLRRAGKLSFSPADGWLLQVEQTGIDILLDSLPWGLGMVKTPWMKEMMTVEWRS